MTCYLPELKAVRIDRQVADRSFPAILPAQLADLAEHYSIRLGDAERVAGFDTIMPYYKLELDYMPDAARIGRAIDDVMAY